MQVRADTRKLFDFIRPYQRIGEAAKNNVAPVPVNWDALAREEI